MSAYEIQGIADVDRFQNDLLSACRSTDKLRRPASVRPRLSRFDEGWVLALRVDEAPRFDKPFPSPSAPGTGAASCQLRKAEIVDAIASSQRAPFPRILDLLRRDELKVICRAAGIDDSGRTRTRIAERRRGRRGTQLRPGRPRAKAAAPASPWATID